MLEDKEPAIELPNGKKPKKPNKILLMLRKPVSILKVKRFRFLFMEYKISGRMYGLSTIYKFETMTLVVVAFHSYSSI